MDVIETPVVNPVVNIPASTYSEAVASKGKAFLALGGAMLWPGMGHFLAGNFYLGAMWFTLWTSIVVGAIEAYKHPDGLWLLAFLVPAGAIVALLQLLDAVRCGRKSKRAMLGDALPRYALGAGMLAVALVGQQQALGYLQDNIYELCYTPSPSMAPTLSDGDKFITLKGLEIHRWDIVGANAPPELLEQGCTDIIKRVVGMPGDRIELTGDGVMINGKLATLPPDAGPFFAVDRSLERLNAPSRTMAGNGCWGRPIVLGPDEYYLLGDNTMESLDARFWSSMNGHQPGAMPRDQIKSVVVGICWPVARWRMFPH